MTKLTKEQLNSVKNTKPLGIVRIDNCTTDELRVERFHEIDAFNFDGHTIKNFYRVNADIFKYVFEEIRNNPSCSFVTPYNGVIREGVMPETVSVLIKETHKCFEEKLGCQLMNYYGINTPVNVAVAGGDLFGLELYEVAKNNKELQKNIRKYHKKDGLISYVVSMDFAAEGEEFEEFPDVLDHDLGGTKKVFFWNPADALQYVEKELKKKLKNPKLKNLTKEQIENIITKFKEDFILTMLVRRIVFQDTDFNNSNVGAIIKDNGLDMMNIDFEYGFNMHVGAITAGPLIEYAQANYPKVWDKFYSKSKELFENIEQADNRTVRSTMGVPSLVDGMIQSLKFLVKNYSKINISNM